MIMKTLFRLAVSFVLAGLMLSTSHAANGANVALVIGNQRYPGEALANADADARLMARTLTELGFAVTERHDLGRAEFASAVSDFAASIPRDATALVYYAGHGMQIAGSNYLNPVDMQVTSEQGTPLRAYPLKTLLDQLAKAQSAVNIVVLDACRNNPFRPRGDVRYRSLQDLGLARVAAPRGTFIAYSTAPGQLAADGTGGNSLYTQALARALREPGRDLEEVFRKVANDVRKKTLDDQIPWVESSLVGKVYFRRADSMLASNAAVAQTAPGQGNAPGVKPRYRGKESAEEEPWYRQMPEAEWNRIDWEIQQRMKRLTPDELPALEHKAKAGNVMAQTVLGLAYRDGFDKAVSLPSGLRSGSTVRFRPNNTKAWQWLKKAADAGFPVAQAEIGEMYYAGHGVDRNLRQSRHWIEQAATAHYPRAKLDLVQLVVEMDGSTAGFGEAMQSIFNSVKPGAPSR